MSSTAPSRLLRSRPTALIPWSRSHRLAAFAALVAIVAALAVGALLIAGGEDATVIDPVVPAAEAGDTTGSSALRFDGGPEEGRAGATSIAITSPRFDGGPDEGTAGH